MSARKELSCTQSRRFHEPVKAATVGRQQEQEAAARTAKEQQKADRRQASASNSFGYQAEESGESRRRGGSRSSSAEARRQLKAEKTAKEKQLGQRLLPQGKEPVDRAPKRHNAAFNFIQHIGKAGILTVLEKKQLQGCER